MPLLRKRLERPDETRTFPNGHLEVYSLGDTIVGRQTFEPGFRWSTDIKPTAGTEWCEVFHQGLVMSGRLRVEMSDGPELELGPGDWFEVPPGHDAWVVGDEPWVSVDFAGRRNFAQSDATRGRHVVSTVLFTDIVDSTRTASRLGDVAWRTLVAEHNNRVRREIERFRGREVKTTGDGLLVLFDSAAAGIRAGLGMAAAMAELGLEIRVGLHSGEVELAASDVRGIAVHAAARVMSAAGAGEVLLSRTTRDLATGSGLAFVSRGTPELKGISEPLELFAVVPGG